MKITEIAIFDFFEGCGFKKWEFYAHPPDCSRNEDFWTMSLYFRPPFENPNKPDSLLRFYFSKNRMRIKSLHTQQCDITKPSRTFVGQEFDLNNYYLPIGVKIKDTNKLMQLSSVKYLQDIGVEIELNNNKKTSHIKGWDKLMPLLEANLESVKNGNPNYMRVSAIE